MEIAKCYGEYLAELEKAEPIKFVHDLSSITLEQPLCVFTGHRPMKLPFHGENDPASLMLRSALGDRIIEVYNSGCRNFMSGMAKGTDTWAALEVLKLKYRFPDIRLFAAVPYLQQADSWYGWEKDRYCDMLRLCERVYVVKDKPSRQAPVIRDAFMVAHASRMIAVYDGSPEGGTAITVRMARKKGIDIMIINPGEYRPELVRPEKDC